MALHLTVDRQQATNLTTGYTCEDNQGCTRFWFCKSGRSHIWPDLTTLQYLYAPFCKSGQKPKSGYIFAGVGFVKMASFQPEPESKSDTTPRTIIVKIHLLDHTPCTPLTMLHQREESSLG